MIRKQLYIVATFLLLFTYCTEKQSTTPTSVRLKGQIIGLGNEVALSYGGASSYLGDLRSFTISTDEQGYFDTIFVINEPAYYNISRNILYLSPGDDLTVKLTSDNLDAEYEGVGSEISYYLKNRLYTQGGSFLESSKNIIGDFNTTKSYIDSLAEARFTELSLLNNASDEFKQLEEARIKADIANSYLSFMNYAGYAMKSRDLVFELPSSIEEHYKSIKQYVNPLFKDISDEKFLDIEVVRSMISLSNKVEYSAFFEGVEIPERTKELLSANNEIRKITSNASVEDVEGVLEFSKTLVNKDFAQELEHKAEMASRLFSGKPAIDFELEDVEGNKMLLSSLKGKVLYIDLWASWCAPCIQEAPYFESLSKEYVGKDILFIPISTDTDKEQWLNAIHSSLTQYRSLDINLHDGWGVVFIPRFLLIDKDFNIVDAYALRPSDEKVKEVINSLLDK